MLSSIWSPREIAAWRPPEGVTAAEWASLHRWLDPENCSQPGKYDPMRTPYVIEIMNAFSDPVTSVVSTMCSGHVAHTDTTPNCLAYIMDQAPGPSMWVMPDKEEAVAFQRGRIRPMLRSSPRLRQYISKRKNDDVAGEIYVNGMRLFMRGARSPAGLASRAIKYLFMDETDKFPPWSGREADPIKLASERQRTYRGESKRFLSSTPSTEIGFIWTHGWQKSDKCMYYVPCPHCSHFFPMQFEFDMVKYPKDEDPEVIAAKRLAHIICPDCGKTIEDNPNLKDRMMRNGLWVPEECTVKEAKVVGESTINSHRGFHLNAMYSPWLNWSDVAKEFLESKDSPGEMMNFTNSWKGLPWIMKSTQTTKDMIRNRAVSYSKGTVPDEALVLCMGVDVQLECLYYVIRAWGTHQRSWLLEAGRVNVDRSLQWLKLAHILEDKYHRQDGAPMGVRCMAIDMNYRGDEVIAFTRVHHPWVIPVQGSNTPLPTPSASSKLCLAENGDVIHRHRLDPLYWKDRLNNHIHMPLGGENSWMIHRDPHEDYVTQMVAEHRVAQVNKVTGRVTGQWVPKRGHGANHWFDCEYYAQFAADFIGVFSLQDGDTLDENDLDDGGGVLGTGISEGESW